MEGSGEEIAGGQNPSNPNTMSWALSLIELQVGVDDQELPVGVLVAGGPAREEEEQCVQNSRR